ncbi:coproporphyrinogen III oxidase [Pedobacter mucosus]|uniref:coproporphyrinogen III oxidase n=1 Tax=Pedobacter mucosus TaxID=2895286 RepID=UPI001EE48333|nr:coproporphyrinogen III oxidase [Pedobacter mucosus]UKT64770.1 coproporphyrinogen III oxidase [Pedobacter mucosus]
MINSTLLKNYNIAEPSFIRNPIVPYLENAKITQSSWIKAVLKTHHNYKNEGISLYIQHPICENVVACEDDIMQNQAMVQAYLKALIKEWKMYVKILGEMPKINKIHFGGQAFAFFNPKNLDQLLKGILLNATLVSDAAISFKAHPANTTMAHLEVLHKFGFKRLDLGVRELNSSGQLLNNHQSLLLHVAEITNAARTIGYNFINFELPYGLPGQSISGLTNTIIKAVRLQPDQIFFNPYDHVSWIKRSQSQYEEKNIPIGDEKFALYQLGKVLLQESGYKDIGMSHFVAKDRSSQTIINQKSQRSFVEYTNQLTHSRIGLGVSAISDSWGAFAKNPKTTEVYFGKIAKGILPFINGHLLNQRDIGIRKHIFNIVCEEKTLYNDGIPEEVYCRLLPLIRNRLISITEKEIKVNTKGKFFIGNICMALDEKLWLKNQESELLV